MTNEDPNQVADIVDSVLKYKATNYSKVAEMFSMSRQVFFRMVKNGTLKMSLFLEMLDAFNLRLDIKDDNGLLDNVPMKAFSGERVKKRIKGVFYDTEKMVYVGKRMTEELGEECLFFNPVTCRFVIVRENLVDGKKPKFILVDEEQIDSVIGEFQ